MNDFSNSDNSNYNLKLSYGEGRDIVGDVLSRRRKKLADTKFGIVDQFPPVPRTDDPSKKTGLL
jgi:hypothetical protein